MGLSSFAQLPIVESSNTISFTSRILQRLSRPRLERELERASKSVRHRDAFYHALLEDSIWVPGTVSAGEVFIQPFDLDGRRTILAFTSERKLNEALRHNAGALELPGRALLSTLPEYDSLIIDYRTRLQKEMTPSEVAAVLDGSIFTIVRNGAASDRVLLGRPRHYPVPLLDALRPLLADQSDVRAAYMCQVQRERESDANLIIGIDGPSAAIGVVSEFVARVDPSIAVVGLKNDATSEYMRRETEPWWKR